MSKAVRIKYDYYRASLPEKCLLVVSLGLFGVFVYLLLSVPINTWSAQDKCLIAVLVIIAVLALFPYFAVHKARMDKIKNAREIVEHGEKIIGTIKNLNVIKINQLFTYDIEYEFTNSQKLVTMTTPRVIADEMYIKDEDLPLKVVIYIYKGESLAYSIIDPPIHKMHKRKIFKILQAIYPALILVVALIIAAILSMNGLFKLSANFIFGGLLLSGLCFVIKNSDHIDWTLH